jgi:hypothetical protein
LKGPFFSEKGEIAVDRACIRDKNIKTQNVQEFQHAIMLDENG